MKKILLFSALVAVLIILILLLLKKEMEKQGGDDVVSPNSATSTMPSSTSTTTTPALSSTGFLELKIDSGEKITVRDFTHDENVHPDTQNEGYYIIGSAASNTPYIIAYQSGFDSLTVTLLLTPLGKARKEAEEVIKRAFGVSDEKLCGLNYFVGVPDAVDSEHSGVNLKFSFCPGSIQL
jgi:hypothetical protein